MITAYVGLPGSGKSYGVCEQVIIPALKEGRTVWSNIPLDNELCLAEFGACPVFFDTDDIKENPKWWFDVFEAGAIIVIDECWALWPAGLKANNATDEDKEFLFKHRHMTGNGHATEIVLVTQDLAQIASFARAMVETTYRAKKLTEVGADNSFKIQVYTGSVTGNKPPESALVNTLGPFKYREKVWRYYKSQTRGSGQSSEVRVDKRLNVLKSTRLKVYIVIVIVFFGFSFYMLSNSVKTFLGDDVESLSPIPDSQPISNVYEMMEEVIVESNVPNYISDLKSLYISNNNSIIGYRFTLDSDYDADFSVSDLRRLDVRVEIINSCVVRLTYESSFLAIVGCKKEKFEEPEILPELSDFS
jgi:zona occludens toxin